MKPSHHARYEGWMDGLLKVGERIMEIVVSIGVSTVSDSC